MNNEYWLVWYTPEHGIGGKPYPVIGTLSPTRRGAITRFNKWAVGFGGDYTKERRAGKVKARKTALIPAED